MKKALHLIIIHLFIPGYLFSGIYQGQARMSIPNTPITLIPPINFVLTDHFDGFLNMSTYSSISAKIEVGKNSNEFKTRFTKEYFQATGLSLIKQEEIKTNSITGTLYLLSYIHEGTNMQRYMLVTGNNQNTYFIMGNYPVGFKSNVSEPIKRSLMTVQYQ